MPQAATGFYLLHFTNPVQSIILGNKLKQVTTSMALAEWQLRRQIMLVRSSLATFRWR
jgi:hypothetical protein